MKVIIAYDGSTYADAAIDDLARAGFPPDSEVLVVSVADFSSGGPAVSEFDLISAASRRIDTVLARARNHEAQVLRETRRMASEVEHRVSRQFPDWNVRSEVVRGMPSDELLRLVDSWNADLIMGGSQGRSAIGRFFLGSVSKSVAEEAPSSVRVVRSGFEKPDGAPLQIILGAKTPSEAERLIEAVRSRVWPPDTRFHLIGVDDGVLPERVSASYSDGKTIYETVGEGLTKAGLDASVQLESGDPKTVLLGAADTLRADAIFVVAGDAETGKLDATASGLVTNAKCTVEIVR